MAVPSPGSRWPGPATSRRGGGGCLPGRRRPGCRDGCSMLLRTGQTGTSEHILLDEMIPPASTTYLHDVYLKLTQGHRKHRQLRPGACLTCRTLQFVAVDVVDVDQVLPSADGAAILGLVTVETR